MGEQHKNIDMEVPQTFHRTLFIWRCPFKEIAERFASSYLLSVWEYQAGCTLGMELELAGVGLRLLSAQETAHLALSKAEKYSDQHLTD